MELITEIEIAAPAHVVWAELTAFEAYPEWNPFIRKIEGRLSMGEQLKCASSRPADAQMTFRPKVLVADANTELRWIGKFLVRGLLDGGHSFHLQAIGRDVTKFTQRETFKGLLVPLFAKRLSLSTRKGFEMMNEILKVRAESRSA
jgi:hypothetical protein